MIKFPFFFGSGAGGSTPISQLLKNISFIGSSITWAVGNLQDGFPALVDYAIKDEKQDFVLHDDSGVTYSVATSNFTQSKCYQGGAKEISGIGETIEFDITGNKLAICQAIKRTSNFANIEVFADNVSIGTFNNQNPTVGTHTENFTGDGSAKVFRLSNPHTYNHTVTVGGVAISGHINADTYGNDSPNSGEYIIFRGLDASGDPTHFIWFETPPANSSAIVVQYSTGKVIFYEKSTVGQTTSDLINESNFGSPNINFNPNSNGGNGAGLEYRNIDERAFFNYDFGSTSTRTIKIEITGGTNPYFIFNFASSGYYDFMNAGIGGWGLVAFTDDNDVNDYEKVFTDFTPDILVNEFATNDDWVYSSRRLRRSVSGLSEAEIKELNTLEMASVVFDDPNYTATFTSGIIDAITSTSLTSSHIVDSGTIVGDIVRIGTYYGDNKHVVCREVETVNLTTGVITWTTAIDADDILNIDSIADLVGKEVSIRDLTSYENLYKSYLDKMLVFAPNVKLFLVNPGLSNYFRRQLWGYGIIHSRIASQYNSNNCEVIDVTSALHERQRTADEGLVYQEITADGSDEYEISIVTGGHWQGFRVMVGGQNVYGEDCYVKTIDGYTVNQSGSGAGLAFDELYNRSNGNVGTMKVVFFRNAPLSGTITVYKAETTWSHDFTHPSNYGHEVYADIIKEKLMPLI